MSELDTGAEREIDAPSDGGNQDSGDIRSILETASTEDTESTPAEATPEEGQPEGSENSTLLAGKYRTPADLEKAYSELQQKLSEQGNELGELRKLKPDTVQPEPEATTGESEEEIPILLPDELEQLRDELHEEHGRKAGEQLYREYVAKMEEHKIAKIVEARVKSLRDVVEPLAKKESELTAKEAELSRQRFVEDTKASFGDSYENLQKQLLDQEYVHKILDKCPTKDSIMAIAQAEPEKAHRMILWELQNAQLREAQGKRKKSIPADIPSSGSNPNKRSSFGDIRDCFNASLKD